MSLANLVIKVQSIRHIQHVTFDNRYLILKKNQFTRPEFEIVNLLQFCTVLKYD